MTSPGKPASRPARSQLTTEMALTAVAVIVALGVARLVLHVVRVEPLTWTRRVVDLASLPFVWPLQHLPGGSRVLVGDATLADLTVVAVAILALIVVGARGGRP